MRNIIIIIIIIIILFVITIFVVVVIVVAFKYRLYFIIMMGIKKKKINLSYEHRMESKECIKRNTTKFNSTPKPMIKIFAQVLLPFFAIEDI